MDEEEGEMKLSDFITECAALRSSMDTFTRHLLMSGQTGRACGLVKLLSPIAAVKIL